jgi:hypothetical protein
VHVRIIVFVPGTLFSWAAAAQTKLIFTEY